MKKENLKHLKEVLSIPTKTWKEELMIQYLTDYCVEKGFNYSIDKNGSVYANNEECRPFLIKVLLCKSKIGRIQMVL